MKSIRGVIVPIALTLLLSSCAGLDTNQKQGTAIGAGVGAGVGAILGQAIGHNTDSTLIGAGIGAALGGLAGNQVGLYMDNQERELRNIMANSEAASIRRSQDVLVATFKGETFFEHDSSALLPGGYNEIARMASVLNRYPQTQIEVGGHTDSTGSEQYNQQLSLRRAHSVENALIQQGVAYNRIRAVGYGETRPISSSHAMNRRVEVVIIPVTQ
ncbi:OmpA family protein [Desulfogranum marinum]|jgi:outer membrane protein OmpA-like peptidoglycan-associated protein|uniref:OmpA family protein n=1 Tax=Desulfogranum marinum TaxID=453220 RepID=UPI0019646415|nr:OmpA family protein [Desulfogranum marinum]MBM9514910.1 OmpA family protein [Desulfogranum marinum]